MQIFLTFGKTQVKSECTPHYWLSFAELITWHPLGLLERAANLGEIISVTETLLKVFRNETAEVSHLHMINIPLEFRLKVFNSSPWDTGVPQVCVPPCWLLSQCVPIPHHILIHYRVYFKKVNVYTGSATSWIQYQFSMWKSHTANKRNVFMDLFFFIISFFCAVTRNNTRPSLIFSLFFNIFQCFSAEFSQRVLVT